MGITKWVSSLQGSWQGSSGLVLVSESGKENCRVQGRATAGVGGLENVLCIEKPEKLNLGFIQWNSWTVKTSSLGRWRSLCHLAFIVEDWVISSDVLLHRFTFSTLQCSILVLFLFVWTSPMIPYKWKYLVQVLRILPFSNGLSPKVMDKRFCKIRVSRSSLPGLPGHFLSDLHLLHISWAKSIPWSVWLSSSEWKPGSFSHSSFPLGNWGLSHVYKTAVSEIWWSKSPQWKLLRKLKPVITSSAIPSTWSVSILHLCAGTWPALPSIAHSGQSCVLLKDLQPKSLPSLAETFPFLKDISRISQKPLKSFQMILLKLLDTSVRSSWFKNLYI